jgi:acetyl esterase/lipase
MDAAAEADRAYANAAFIPGADAYPPRWRAAAAAFRATARWEEHAYGAGDRHRLDLFLPAGEARGLLVFLHGGYWMAFDRRDWSHLAAGAVARGWASALPSYTLAPQAGLGAMVAEAAAACGAARVRVPGPLVVTGHSAGGHLAARLGCADGPAGVVRVVPISPLAELAPLMQTAMNATLGIDAATAATESPARLPLRAEAHVWVGGRERPAFLWQARTLSEAWDCPWTVVPGRHHFDVIDDLAEPGSALLDACLGGF